MPRDEPLGYENDNDATNTTTTAPVNHHNLADNPDLVYADDNGHADN
jgi:hypothetical protein